ncbi:hypothetical protein [Zunongwangia sp. HGR-M22]|uniref:hypothetical protein n=1 Tax=Zunongwangia sp. HGR-M22 TaxID=3015168 RepID=UPI0022DD8DDA|nr:hypothetical protein [Zunongwangia sp. HGR-M22]WBL26284.1 hypothetical protein PBT91_03135 [Zunongwangia sp. HGR-M22]
MKKIILPFLFVLSIVACKNTENENTSSEMDTETTEVTTSNEKEGIGKTIAMANGLDKFEKAEEIEFTFNVKIQDSLRSSRHWKWNRKTNEISLTEGDTTLSYTKNDSIPQDKKDIDQKFINDSYWLLFPYQLVWSDAKLTEEKEVAAPISGDTLSKLEVAYSNDGGYTPGDTYDIYYGNDNMIKEWVYKAAAGDRQMATTWEDYEEFMSIPIAKMHKSEDGSFQLYFTDIVIK